jgi:hypothetical protein
MELEGTAEKARYDKNLKYRYHVLLQGNANVFEIYKTYHTKHHSIYILAKRVNDEFSRLRYLPACLSIYLSKSMLVEKLNTVAPHLVQEFDVFY